jgi:protein gp37
LAKNRMGLDVWGPPSTTDRPAVKNVFAKLRKERRLMRDRVPSVQGAGKPHLVFVGSMMDWAEHHPDAAELRPVMWRTIREYPDLVFQLLTKRAENIAGLLPADWGDGYDNVWLGTSIENNDYVDRADHLRRIPARVHFISYEPALGPLDRLDLAGIEWVIYGGESGPGYRPEDKQWARDMRDRCRSADVAFFHKQSAAPRTEMGIELDGQIVREFPVRK